MPLSSAERDLLTTLKIGSSLLWETMLWLSVSVIKKTKLRQILKKAQVQA